MEGGRVSRISRGEYAQRGRAVPVCGIELYAAPDVVRGRRIRLEHPAKSQRARMENG